MRRAGYQVVPYYETMTRSATPPEKKCDALGTAYNLPPGDSSRRVEMVIFDPEINNYS